MNIVSDIKAALATISGSLTGLKEQLATTNQQIAGANAKLQALYDAPLSLEDYGILILPSNRGHSFKHSSGPRRLAG